MPPVPQSVFLIGYRGTGKSSTGRALAARLGVPFIDTDERIRAQTGEDIATTFRERGEDAFRDIEQRVVSEVSRRALDEPVVVAAGGGVVVRPENVQAMRSSGTVVWLTAEPAVLRRRIEADSRSAAQRPSLTGAEDASDEIERVLSVRAPLYQGAAHRTVATDGLSPEEVVERLLARLPKDGRA